MTAPPTGAALEVDSLAFIHYLPTSLFEQLPGIRCLFLNGIIFYISILVAQPTLNQPTQQSTQQMQRPPTAQVGRPMNNTKSNAPPLAKGAKAPEPVSSVKNAQVTQAAASLPKRPTPLAHPQRDEPPDIIVDDLDASYTPLDLAHQRLLFFRAFSDRLFPVGPDFILQEGSGGSRPEEPSIDSFETLKCETVQMERRFQDLLSNYQAKLQVQKDLFKSLEDCQSMTELDVIMAKWQEIS